MKARDYATYLGNELSPGSDSFKFRPSVVYPATIAFIKEKLVSNEATPDYLRQPMGEARKVTSDGWRDALLSTEGLTTEARIERSNALEAARLVFTALLREQNGGPIHIRIVVEDDQDAQYRF